MDDELTSEDQANKERWLNVTNQTIAQIVAQTEMNRHQVIDGLMFTLEYLHDIEIATIAGMN